MEENSGFFWRRLRIWNGKRDDGKSKIFKFNAAFHNDFIHSREVKELIIFKILFISSNVTNNFTYCVHLIALLSIAVSGINFHPNFRFLENGINNNNRFYFKEDRYLFHSPIWNIYFRLAIEKIENNENIYRETWLPQIFFSKEIKALWWC